MTRNRWSPSVNQSRTSGTTPVPATCSRAYFSRSSLEIASAPSAASPACGRPSLRTTLLPSRVSVPAYTPPPFEKCSAFSIRYGRSPTVVVFRAARCGSRNAGNVTHSGTWKDGARRSGISFPAPSRTAGTSEPRSSTTKVRANAP
ncbi:hypothetical protein QF037_001341 [Streptomyces canus]|nr:hypothetical protein [Streptomyces canus]